MRVCGSVEEAYAIHSVIYYSILCLSLTTTTNKFLKIETHKIHQHERIVKSKKIKKNRNKTKRRSNLDLNKMVLLYLRV